MGEKQVIVELERRTSPAIRDMGIGPDALQDGANVAPKPFDGPLFFGLFSRTMPMDADQAGSRAGSLPLVGGVLALDFCNTASGRGTAGHLEHLRSALDVLVWARHAAILDEAIFGRLQDLCGRDRGFAAKFLADALALRDAIFRLDVALTRRLVPDQADIDSIATTHARCLAKARLTMNEGGFGWTWNVDDGPGELVLGPIAASAMAVITAADRARLKQCGGHHCGWLFLDTTKSNNRRWCEMEVCGNRAKQKRRRGREAGM